MLTNTLCGDGATALLVVGEAGVGKSRLIGAAAALMYGCAIWPDGFETRISDARAPAS